MSKRKKRPGFLSQYAKHAGIALSSAAEQLRRVGVNYLEEFDFDHADKLRLAMRHADRAPFAKPIYCAAAETAGQESGNLDPNEAALLNVNPTFAEAQTRERVFKAKLAELEFDERIGKLVFRDVVEAEAFRIGRLVRDAVLNVPSRLAGILAAEMDQRRVHDLLEKELRQALEALAIDGNGGEP